MQTDRRRTTVRQLWMQRPAHDRMAADMMTFYIWLSRNRPELLTRGKTFGEAHQHVVSDLRGLVGVPRDTTHHSDDLRDNVSQLSGKINRP